MKKIICLFMLMAMLLCFVPAASAAGSAFMGGPNVVRAGDTIKVTFYAGGGIYGGSGSLSYDSSVLTLQSCTQSIGGSWAVEFGGSSFVFYDNSMSSPISGSAAIFQATFLVNSTVAPGTTVTVTASGVTLSDGQQDMGVGSVSYSTTIAEPLSDNCNLKSMTVTGAAITPAFSAGVTNYTASVPFTTPSITVSAEAEDDGATVEINNPALTAGATTYVQVTVTAENGATKTYSIAVARAQDPNYVESSNANLSELSVEGYALSPVFDQNVTQYYIWLPYEEEHVAISAQQEDEKASLEIGTYEQLIPGQGTDIPVTVTAEDGTQKVYTITVVRAPEHDKVEAYINGEREPVPEEPVTEPEPAPTQEPTEPEAAPTDVSEKAIGYSKTTLILTGVIAAVAGAGIMALILFLIRKKSKPFEW